MQSAVRKRIFSAINSERAIELFEPPSGTVYTIETASQLAQVPRRTILIYYKYGLVSPAADPADIGYFFDGAAIRHLRRIHDLRNICGDDLPGIKAILGLMAEVERLRWEVRSLRQPNARGETKENQENVAKKNGRGRRATKSKLKQEIKNDRK
ncbi:MAG: MerR family transcriptional regulator, heat shock protein HspR [Verrucomicrobiota bacterium]|jgi:DNA-binding transcriptional MerR regulator